MTTEKVDEFSNKVVNFLKTNGKFDEFRKKCATEIEHHTSFVNARREVEELVRLRVVNNRKSEFPLTKNQLRQEIRSMLSKRKDLLAAADSSIQFSLHKNKSIFAKEIDEVSSTFEEEEKEKKEADKIALAEKLANESPEAERLPEPDDIPPPPPPPRPATKPVSSNDTALLMQEAVFNSNIFSTPHTMTINDLLANVQSSDFTGLPQPVPTPESEVETENYASNYNRYADIPPKDVVQKPIESFDTEPNSADKVYNFDKDEYQYSNYIESKSDRSRYDKIRTYPTDPSRYGYEHSEYKRSDKSRKYADDYRDRSYSKHSRNSLSPKQIVELDKYTRRDYPMDRVFKSPDYYHSSSRSSSGRSSSSRDRKKREEEWYAKHHYSLKYGYSFNSQKYAESSRRDEYLKEYSSRHEKRRQADAYYKTSDKLQLREVRDRTYSSDVMIREIRSSVDNAAPYKEISYENDMKAANSSPLLSPSQNIVTSKTFESNSKIAVMAKAEQHIMDNIIAHPHEITKIPTSSPDNLDSLVEKAISNIAKTPEYHNPLIPKDESDKHDVFAPSAEQIKPQSPIKSPVLSVPIHQDDVSSVSSKQALIDSILPKPKYCSILKENFSSMEDERLQHPEHSEQRVSPKYPSPCTPPPKQVFIDEELKESQQILQNFGLKPSVLEEETDITSQLDTPTIGNLVDINSQPFAEPTLPVTIEHHQPVIDDVPVTSSSDVVKHDNQDFSLNVNNEGVPVDNESNKKTLQEILGGMRKPTPSSPIILTTSRMRVTRRIPSSSSKPRDSSDTEEGEILSDHDEDPARSITILSSSKMTTDPTSNSVSMDKIRDIQFAEKVKLYEEKVGEEGLTPTPDSGTETNTNVIGLIPTENFVIKSKKDLFKARFFQPDMKIDFAKPEVKSENFTDDKAGHKEERKQEQPEKKESEQIKPNPDDFKYSRKMRFKEVLQQHMNDHVNDSTKDEIPEQKVAVIEDKKVCSTSTPAPQPVPESDGAVLSLLGKRKRFLNDYIASLESNPASKPEEPVTADQLPKLRIKPTSSGLYSSETLSTDTPAPPPLRKAASPDVKDGVPKCIIKFGKSNWNMSESDSPPTKGNKGKKRKPPPRRSLRSREASTDSGKSADVQENAGDKPRITRSRKVSKTPSDSLQIYENTQIDDGDKSDNSFDDNEKSRKSGRTRKSIKRLNL